MSLCECWHEADAHEDHGCVRCPCIAFDPRPGPIMSTAVLATPWTAPRLTAEERLDRLLWPPPARGPSGAEIRAALNAHAADARACALEEAAGVAGASATATPGGTEFLRGCRESAKSICDQIRALAPDPEDK